MSIYRFSWGQREDAQVWIVDFGSKSTPLIAQQLREIGLQSIIMISKNVRAAYARYVREGHGPRVVILSGGPAGVYEQDAPHLDKGLVEEMQKDGVLIFGICYGAQFIAQLFGGIVRKAEQVETGITELSWSQELGGFRIGAVVMNHGDEVVVLPEGWDNFGSTPKCRYAFFGKDKMLGVQFHPEMDHTREGKALFSYLVFTLAHCEPDYSFNHAQFVAGAAAFIRAHAKRKNVVVAFSGGVDSAVALTLAQKALGARRAHAIFVDTGFLREGEIQELQQQWGGKKVGRKNFHVLDERESFWRAIEAIPFTNEEEYYDEVRKVMGHTFVEVFTRFAQRECRDARFLVQGTNNADIVESVSGLKRHHNVGGLPDKLPLHVLEPVAGLYKSEIRQLASHLQLSEDVVWRQPSPGPGNAIRSWGPMTRDKARALAKANRILEEVVRRYYPVHSTRPSQYYVALMPLSTCGIMGDKRVYGFIWGVRAVSFYDRENYASAHPFEFRSEVRAELNNRLLQGVVMDDGTPFVHVFYDDTPKPPSTIEPH